MGVVGEDRTLYPGMSDDFKVQGSYPPTTVEPT